MPDARDKWATYHNLSLKKMELLWKPRKDRKWTNERFFVGKILAFVLILSVCYRLLSVFYPFAIHPFPSLSQFWAQVWLPAAPRAGSQVSLPAAPRAGSSSSLSSLELSGCASLHLRFSSAWLRDRFIRLIFHIYSFIYFLFLYLF